MSKRVEVKVSEGRETKRRFCFTLGEFLTVARRKQAFSSSVKISGLNEIESVGGIKWRFSGWMFFGGNLELEEFYALDLLIVHNNAKRLDNVRVGANISPYHKIQHF